MWYVGAMQKHLVYALSDPKTNEVRYIGRSSTGLKRPRARHLGHCGLWIAKLKRSGVEPDILVLQSFEPCVSKVVNLALNSAEKEWIAFGRAMGWDLTNMSDGGEGLLNPSDEVREKMAAAKRGRTHPGYTRGSKYSDETRRRMSEAQKGKVISAETRAKISAAQRGIPQPNKAKSKQRASLRADSTSGFKGVTWNKPTKRWLAKIGHERRRFHLGLFEDPRDAARAYDEAALKLFGSDAATNKSLGLL